LFHVKFAEEHARYLKRIDTIPILRIDSVCVYGGCVDIETCSKVVMRRELSAAQDALEKERITGKKAELEFSYSDVGIGHRTYDLYIDKSDNTLCPESFISVGGPKLPAACNDSTGTITLHMRLLDRTTKKVIARESRKLDFRVSTRKVWYNRPHNKE